jgi:type II secretory pathway predicted ATPase ExeA
VLAIVLVAQAGNAASSSTCRGATRWPASFINRCEVATLAPLHQQPGRPTSEHKLARVGNVKAIEALFSEDGAYQAIRARWTKIDPATHASCGRSLYPLIVNNTATRAFNRAAELGLAAGRRPNLIREL